MAWIRAMGGAKKLSAIYKDGVFNVPTDNPGSYTFQGSAMIPATLASNKFTVAGSTGSTACIGTSGIFDFTNYNVLKVRCKVLTGNFRVFLSGSKTNYNISPYSNTEVTSTSEHTVTIDVSSLTTAYLCFSAQNVASGEIYEVTVE